MEKGDQEKGKVCVTGGTGFVASWLIMKLLQRGYSVNTTVRFHTVGSKKDISFLTSLPTASEKLRVFNADLDDPGSFHPAIEGCIGVFHVAHPNEHDGKETEETIAEKSVQAMLGILKACLDAKTVKRVVYTSSASAVIFAEKGRGDVVLDESTWSDVDYIRSSNMLGASYSISKTLTEKAALEFGVKHCLDVVTVVPSLVLGPFICDGCPVSVKSSLAMFVGDEKPTQYLENTPLVHTDDVARAHIFIFENTEAKGRYICSAVEMTNDNLSEFISKKYPGTQILSTQSYSTEAPLKLRSISSKKLLDAGFRFNYGLEEMFDGAIESCKQKGIL